MGDFLTSPRAGNGIAVRVDAGMAEHVDAFQDFVGDGVFAFLGLLVDLGPIQAEHFHEEQFDQSMAA